MLRFVVIFAFVSVCFGSLQSDINESLQNLNVLRPLATYYKNNPSTPEVFAIGTSTINSTLNSLSEKLAAYDPLNIEEYEISIERNYTTLSGVVSNLSFRGFSGFVATSLSLSLLTQTLTFTIVLPEIELTTDYDIDGTISFIPIYGKGNLSVLVSDIEATGSAKVSLSNPISVASLDLGYSIGGVDVAVTGLINNEDFSELVSELLTDVVADFLNDVSSIVSERLSTFIQEAINSVLGGSSST